ncbi:M3 family metallopeptidase [Phytoactinopolyspora halotolerans]|uniref:Dipeptidyl carboxypeptidase n=1 Tax=Phytoactinopolyspora halotolerans TaxID=1981512 RepID=A0A6L9SFK7_9ACTN|nr:M3 family metallopeptidase [Phytoactinopolyspora halotolerans]NEE03408.1 M3 family metallopeptidase [Phytoactinopolyspora halotolerans]
MSSENPFLSPSDLPYQLPPFERIDESHYRPAFERGMAEQRAEIDEIVANPDAPTFENTIVALERTGETLRRVSAVFFNQASADANDTIQEIQGEIAPKLAAHEDAIYLNAELYARVKAVYDADPDLDPESRRLLERYHLDFVRAGAALRPQQQERLREINEELSALSTTFQNKLLADTNASAVVVDDESQLAGLSPDAVAAAAEAARERDLPGSYVLTLILPSNQPVLSSLTDRPLRERIHVASIQRGANANEHNTAETVARIVALRAERAALLGHPHHAAYVLEDSTAGSPAAVHEMLDKLTPAAVANAHAEAAALQESIGDEFQLEPWDWSFYSERVKQAKYQVDAAALRPYFELERVLHDGVFYAANRLYGLSFAERTDLVGYHPEARVFEVTDADGSGVGLFIGDFYTRDSKRGGAWMNSFVDQSALLDTKPVVINNLNISRPPAGEPTLLTFDEVTTLFHEFGHALHGLLSDVRYPKFSGTSVQRDFVEFPSQVNEMWAVWPEVLANYARHYQTGEPLAQEVVDRLRESQIWGEGFKTTEYLAASLLDLAWHELSTEDARSLFPDDAETTQRITRFEADALERAGVAVAAVPPRYRTTYFAHVFAGGYSAGYYSYIWSEVLDADTVDWFTENGGLTRENGDHFRRTLLSRGGSMDEMQAFREFRGRDPQIEPLLTRRGLAS